MEHHYKFDDIMVDGVPTTLFFTVSEEDRKWLKNKASEEDVPFGLFIRELVQMEVDKETKSSS